MKKTLITCITAFAIILSAGTSTAGPLREHGQRGFAPKVHSSASQKINRADGIANTFQATQSSGFSFDMPSERHLGQNNRYSPQQYPAINPNWSWDLSNVGLTGTDTAGYAFENGTHLNWGPTQEGLLPGQVEEDGRYLLGALFLVAAGYGAEVVGTIEGIYDILCLDGRIGPVECYEIYNGG
ncbi:hypothetical protein [Ruegeria atlantica]|uniref:hypothetical protein n=1 Tax=Ruegeria atlantica TaxID=81569 RepID=UPI00147B854E|nr:hypothetical protein [Ruegeria atlantica]